MFPIENHIELKTIFRQNDPKYIEILSQVRKGELSNENIEILQKYVKREYNPEDHNDCQLIKLFPIKSRAEYVNKMMFDRIQEPINKFDLITIINEYLHESEHIKIIPVDGEDLNRSLDGSKIETRKRNKVKPWSRFYVAIVTSIHYF